MLTEPVAPNPGGTAANRAFGRQQQTLKPVSSPKCSARQELKKPLVLAPRTASLRPFCWTPAPARLRAPEDLDWLKYSLSRWSRTMARVETTAVALDRLLAQERAALISGKMSDLDRLAKRKAELIARLAAEPQSEAALHRIRTALLRQDKVIAAVRAGRLSAKAEARETPLLRTYLPDGSAEKGPDQGRLIARRV